MGDHFAIKVIWLDGEEEFLHQRRAALGSAKGGPAVSYEPEKETANG